MLKDLNSDYNSRYSISSKSVLTDVTNIDKYYNKSAHYHSDDNDLQINITFDSPFLLSAYSICNKVHTSYSNSFPKEWILYGQSLTNPEKFYVLDNQNNQQFCGERTSCREEQIKTYDTTTVYRKMKPFKTFIFHQLKNSYNYSYILLRAIDFYGTLCGQDGKCSFIHYTCNPKKGVKNHKFCIVFLIFSK